MRARRRLRRAPWVAAAAVGAASIGYLVPDLPGAASAARVGVWDVTATVVTGPRFLVIVCLTVALVASVLRREPVLPELIRIGSWRSYLAREAGFAVRTILPSVLVVLLICLVGASAAGLHWRPLAPVGSAVGQLSGPVGVAAQLLQVILAFTVLHTALTAIRIMTGSIVPVVATGLLLFSWSSVSVLSLVTIITPSSSAGQSPQIEQALAAGVVADLNTITYLDLPFALDSGLHVVAIGFGVITALSFAAATVSDLRIARARRTSSATALQRTDQP